MENNTVDEGSDDYTTNDTTFLNNDDCDGGCQFHHVKKNVNNSSENRRNYEDISQLSDSS